MSVVLYFVMRFSIRPETQQLEGGKAVVRQGLAEMGKITPKEIRLSIIAVLMLLMWATEGTLHHIDASTVTIIGIAFLLLPRVGVLGWKAMEKMVNWGTLVVFAIGISLGSIVLDTQAASWLSEKIFFPHSEFRTFR